MAFWSKATQEQRLAQIDGAIGLGMTSRQCAMNCQAKNDAAVRYFASQYGRRFPHDGEEAQRKRGSSTIAMSHSAMRRQWEKFGFQTANAPSARIFAGEHSNNLFDPLPLDDEVFA